MTLSCEEFRTVKSEGLYTDQELVVSRLGDREVFDLENLGSTCDAYHGSLHHGHAESHIYPMHAAGWCSKNNTERSSNPCRPFERRRVPDWPQGCFGLLRLPLLCPPSLCVQMPNRGQPV